LKCDCLAPKEFRKSGLKPKREVREFGRAFLVLPTRRVESAHASKGAKAMNTIQTILHPTDFSESADHAFRLARSLARDHQARLVIVHVVPSAAPVASGMLVGSFSYDDPDDVDSELTDRLEAMRESHEDLAIEWRLSKGNVIDGILSTAEDVEAGLIVLGTHGRTGLQRLLMGSIAESIVRKANCSVLTVKTPISHRPVESEYTERPVAATPY